MAKSKAKAKSKHPHPTAQVLATTVEDKGAQAPDAVPSSSDRLSWRFSSLDFDGPWGWASADLATLRQVHQKLCHFEKRTGAEVFGPNVGHKMIAPDHLPKKASRRLGELGVDDTDKLCELRLTGKQRVWGLRQENIIHLLWWDPEHTVFASRR